MSTGPDIVSSDLGQPILAVGLADANTPGKEPMSPEQVSVDRLDPDRFFSFVVTHEGYDASGAPFSRARLTMGIRMSGYRIISTRGSQHLIGVSAYFAFPFSSAVGPQNGRIAARLQRQSDTEWCLIADLVGTDAVLLTFKQLRQLNGGQVHLEIGSSRVILTIGDRYSSREYAEKFELVAGDKRAPLVNEEQIRSGAAPEPETNELTLEGSENLFPSFSRVFYSASARTAILIPAFYGIAYDSDGSSAHCDALVRLTGGGSLEETVQFQFALAPLISQIDRVMVQQAVCQLLNVSATDVHFRLPDLLDSEHPPKWILPMDGDVHVVPDFGNSKFLVSITMRGSPDFSGVLKANRFLAALTRSAQNPFFELALRVAPGVDEQVNASVRLTLTQTSSVGAPVAKADIKCANSGSSAEVRMTNRTPLPLFIERAGWLRRSGDMAVCDVGKSLLPNGSLTIETEEDIEVENLLIDRRLDVTAPVPIDRVRDLVRFDFATEYESRTVIIIDASGVDFQAARVSEIRAAITFVGIDSLSIAPIRLTAESARADVPVTVPMQAGILGLIGIVSINFIGPQGTQATRLKHNFSEKALYIENTTIADSRVEP